jgi:hypothetical protein
MSMATRPCEICKEPILAERLEVIPETILCTRCAGLVGKHGGEFVRQFVQERLSKPGGIKKNFGGAALRTIGRNWTAIDRARADLAALES